MDVAAPRRKTRMSHWKRRLNKAPPIQTAADIAQLLKDDGQARCQYCYELFPRFQILAHERKCLSTRGYIETMGKGEKTLPPRLKTPQNANVREDIEE